MKKEDIPIYLKELENEFRKNKNEISDLSNKIHIFKVSHWDSKMLRTILTSLIPYGAQLISLYYSKTMHRFLHFYSIPLPMITFYITSFSLICGIVIFKIMKKPYESKKYLHQFF